MRENSIFSSTVLKKPFVREYFFFIFLKIMNNELGNYAKRLAISRVAALRHFHEPTAGISNWPVCPLQ